MRTFVISAAVTMAGLAGLGLGQVSWGQETESRGETAPKREVTVAVTGLSEDNQEAVARALEGIERVEYVCPMHPQATSDRPGKCELCGGMELRRQAVRPVASAAPDPARGTVVLTLKPGEAVRLTAVGAALRGGPVRVDSDRLRLPGTAELQVAGLSCAECPERLRSALAELPQVQEATVLRSGDEAAVELALRDGAQLPYVELTRAVASARLRLADVAWSGAAAVAAPAPDAGCAMGCCGG